MRRQRTLRLNVDGLDHEPDVGDVLVADTRWYLVVDTSMKRKYLHALCDVYPRPHRLDQLAERPRPETDGEWWTLR